MSFIKNQTIENVSTVNQVVRNQELVSPTANNQVFNLTSSSKCIQIVNGMNGYTGTIVRLPNATTLQESREFFIFNDTDKLITIQTNTATEVVKLARSGRAYIHLKANTTASGAWAISATSASSFSGTAPVTSFYGGQANNGRILEIIPSVNSELAPFISPTNGLIIAMILGIGSGSTGTGTVGIFKSTDLNTPITTISLSNQSEAIQLGLEVPLNQSDKISVRVTSGSLSKPYLTFYVSAT